jgi:hypothetical protein
MAMGTVVDALFTAEIAENAEEDLMTSSTKARRRHGGSVMTSA